jgi:hypothetical protein
VGLGSAFRVCAALPASSGSNVAALDHDLPVGHVTQFYALPDPALGFTAGFGLNAVLLDLVLKVNVPALAFESHMVPPQPITDFRD